MYDQANSGFVLASITNDSLVRRERERQRENI